MMTRGLRIVSADISSQKLRRAFCFGKILAEQGLDRGIFLGSTLVPPGKKKKKSEANSSRAVHHPGHACCCLLVSAAANTQREKGPFHSLMVPARLFFYLNSRGAA